MTGSCATQGRHRQAVVALSTNRLVRSQTGFTLIEMMVTIAVMAILLAIAVPSFTNATLGSKLSSYANSFVASAHLARSEAIKRNAAVTLCASTDGASCATTGGWQQGWIVLSGTTVIQRQQALPAGMLFTEAGGVLSIIYQSSGINATSTTLTLCRATPSVGSQQREISISATGRPSVAKTTSASCT